MAIRYSRSTLFDVSSLPIPPCRTLWRSLINLGLSKTKPTRRGCRAGIDEISCFAVEKKPDLISLTETWLRDNASTDHLLHIPGYNLVRKDRTLGIHGGVCLYIENSIRNKIIDNLYHPELEVVWVHLRPTRLPRGISCIISGTVYHPPSADDKSMLDYLTASLTTLEGQYPGCGILMT